MLTVMMVIPVQPMNVQTVSARSNRLLVVAQQQVIAWMKTNAPPICA